MLCMYVCMLINTYLLGGQFKMPVLHLVGEKTVAIEVEQVEICDDAFFLCFSGHYKYIEGTSFLIVSVQERERRVLIVKSIYFHILKCKGHNRI